jgi:hypothetical protein
MAVKKLAGPVAMSATMTTNVYNQSSALVFSVVRHVHVANKTAGAVTFSLWLGATGANAAGTELFSAYSVPANSSYDWYGALRMDSTDFLVGGASAATSLTITVEGELNAV